MDRFMPYVAGGVSSAKYQFDLDHDGTGNMDFEEERRLTGWNIGVGAEYAVTNNLLVRAEYRYTDFGSENFDQDWGGEFPRIDPQDPRCSFGRRLQILILTVRQKTPAPAGVFCLQAQQFGQSARWTVSLVAVNPPAPASVAFQIPSLLAGSPAFW